MNSEQEVIKTMSAGVKWGLGIELFIKILFVALGVYLVMLANKDIASELCKSCNSGKWLRGIGIFVIVVYGIGTLMMLYVLYKLRQLNKK